MGIVRVVRGTGTGPTSVASYDAALAEANLHEYNIIPVSSIVPAEATIEVVDRMPDLGLPGHRIWAVEARATGQTTVSAGLAWAKPSDGRGIIYEAEGTDGPDSIEDRLTAGIEAGMRLRSMEVETCPQDRLVVTASQPNDGFATAVVVAVFGKGRSVL